MKLACSFTQTGVDRDGYAVRGELSTKYIGKITTGEDFGKSPVLRDDKSWSSAGRENVCD